MAQESTPYRFGANRESLVRERTVPILEKSTMDIIGTVAFTLVIAKPLMGSYTPPLTEQKRSAEGIQLVGHRVSAREWTSITKGRTSVGARKAKFTGLVTWAGQEQSPFTFISKNQERETVRIWERMKHTVDLKNKGYKPNTRGHSVQDSFTTLEELLTKLPDSISFNIEIKYPRIHEAVEAGVGPIATEINTFIDRILAQIFRISSERAIVLSSFSSEICILLASKQDTYPVLFITNPGKLPMSDMEMRASSLQAA
ncbi:hypothetical protein PENNAL_c0076G05257, partial [Penicillium nalgiovense]